jgi:hypothetical protein
MTNGTDDYESLFDPSAMTVGSATGTLTVDAVPAGTAHGGANSQRYGFQIGLGVDASSPPYRIQSRLVAPFAGGPPEPDQSMGVAFGTGGQDDYVEVALSAGGGSGGVEVRREVGGRTSARTGAAVRRHLGLPASERRRRRCRGQVLRAITRGDRARIVGDEGAHGPSATGGGLRARGRPILPRLGRDRAPGL